MVAKAHHNFDQLDYDTQLNDYCDAFGAARDDVKEYFLALERTTEAAADARCGIAGYIDFFKPAPFEEILGRAAAKADGDKTVLRRIQFLRTGLEYAKRLKRNKAAKDSGDPKYMSYLEDYRRFMHEMYLDDDAFIAVNVRRLLFYDHYLRPLLSR
jgi:hypothetical protein